ncbi:MAG: GNAT family N-acetyltransferase [Spirochaetales bacterium]|nr:GNAT family N-acetyltransferase [Spirochaetales bacterium]
MNIDIKKLKKDVIEDYLYFFDNFEFAEHSDWKKCYCYSYHFTGSAEEWDIEGRNRAKAIELINLHHMRGYLAYDEGKPIGWCNANDKNNYERLKLSEELWNESKEKICSVVCFVISPEYRRKGVATKLLERVCKDYKEEGYDYVEAYPDNKAISSEDKYNGPKSLYEKNKFKIYKKLEEYNIVRREL